MNLEEFDEAVEVTTNTGLHKCLAKANKMARFTINRIFDEYKTEEDGLTGDDIDRLKDCVEILHMSNEIESK